jgi:sporulation protein YlmC with PRC-barrel domain
MRPDSLVKLVSELLDLPLYDVEGKYCGIVDDVEFAGAAGKQLELRALLVGPGAYEGRMPAWAFWLVRTVGGDRLTRVPLAKVRTIGPVVKLDCPGGELGLRREENRVGKWIPRKWAL